MRKSLFRLLPFMSAMLISACGEKPISEPVEPVDPGTPVSGPVDYSYDLMPSTLKTLDGGWKPGENIVLVESGKSSTYTLPSSTSSGLTIVKGEKQASSALYVYSPSGAGIDFLGSSIEASIPYHQSGKDAAAVSYSAAKLSSSTKVKMTDMCARLVFRLEKNSFTTLKVTALSDIKLAGKVRMTFTGSDECSLKAQGQYSEVTFEPGLGGGFPEGDYAIVCQELPDNTVLRFEAIDMLAHGYEAEVQDCSVKWGESRNIGALEFKETSGKTGDLALDQIPDFSRVGYHYGDREIPDVAVKMTLEAPKDKSDARALIQNAIDNVQTPGCILLKAGTYYINGELKIERNGVVIRGEGQNTVLYSTTNTQTSLITLGRADTRQLSASSDIVDSYTPCGSMFVRVANPGMFHVRDVVFLYRPATKQWINDIHMNEIPDRESGSVSQWSTNSFNIYWERRITDIRGDCLYLDNPVVMGIGGAQYGVGKVYKGAYPRISECGVENIAFDSSYDQTVKSGKDYTDENHCWYAVHVYAAENSWIRKIYTKHIGNSGVMLDTGSKLITVEDCHVTEPVSQVTGGRRYAFNLNDCQQCLIKDCTCDNDRHQFALGSRVSGPNVFLRCTGTNSRAEAGPHHRWSTGTLFDNVTVSAALNLHDRSNGGTGQGWACANTVLYNCTAKTIVCQSPWASAQNWAIGCIGQKKESDINYADNLGPRPDGVWISPGTKVTPESLYEYQLDERRKNGISLEGF